VETQKVEVDFIVDGKRHSISVLDTPTLTARVCDLRSAARVPANYLFAATESPAFDYDARLLSDSEAVILQRDGTSCFASWPHGVIGG